MCGGSTSVSFPGPSAQETQLQQAQLDSLTQQKQLVDGFMPFVLQQNGMQPIYGRDPKKDQLTQQIDAAAAAGDTDKLNSLRVQYTQLGFDGADVHNNKNGENAVIGYDYTPEQKALNAKLQGLQTQALDLAAAQNQRSQDALAGKIGPSDALMNQESQDFASLKEDQGRLGNEIIGDSLENSTAKSTSGIQALEALRKTYGSLKSAEINNIIAGGSGEAAGYTSNYRSAAPTSASQAEGGLLAPLAGLTGQYSAAYQPYQFDRSGQFSADASNAANNQSFYNTLLTGLLNGAGNAAGRYAGK